MGFALVALVVLAFALKILAAPDAMPGPWHMRSAMAATAQAPGAAVPGGSASDFHRRGDRPCAFPGHGAIPHLRCCCTRAMPLAIRAYSPFALAPVVAIVTILPSPPAVPIAMGPGVDVSPGRGMAAPPPWSHAPPILRL